MPTGNKSSKMQSMQVANGDEMRAADEIQLQNKCFGCCCDFRNAVIAANSIMLGLQVIVMVFNAPNGNDPQMAGYFVTFIGANLASLGIFGALNFNRCAILTTSVFYFLSVVASLVFFDNRDMLGSLVKLVLAGLFLYPHMYFLILMDDGIIKAENYRTIESPSAVEESDNHSHAPLANEESDP